MCCPAFSFRARLIEKATVFIRDIPRLLEHPCTFSIKASNIALNISPVSLVVALKQIDELTHIARIRWQPWPFGRGAGTRCGCN